MELALPQLAQVVTVYEFLLMKVSTLSVSKYSGMIRSYLKIIFFITYFSIACIVV